MGPGSFCRSGPSSFVRTWVCYCLLSQSFAQGVTTNVPMNHTTIQAAIDAALPGDVIVVAAGTYVETIDFKGKGITLRSADGPQVTTIDGSGLSGSVVQCVTGEGADTVLQGFTITGGNANEGGGMFNSGTSPTVIDCIFTGNTAADRGGGMYNTEGNPIIIGSTFIQNAAVEMGGGMFNLPRVPPQARIRLRPMRYPLFRQTSRVADLACLSPTAACAAQARWLRARCATTWRSRSVRHRSVLPQYRGLSR